MPEEVGPSVDLRDASDLEPLATVLGTVSRHAAARELEWVLIGAAARDLIFRRIPNRQPSRVSLDVDIAVEVESWGAFEQLRNALVTEEGAQRVHGVEHRFVLRGGQPIDIVPYGGVAQDGAIA